MAPEASRAALMENGFLIESLWRSVNNSVGNLENIPGLVRATIEREAWRKRIYRNKTFEHKRFIDFITSQPLAGCGWPPDKVEALIKDDAELLQLWREAITPKHGGNRTVKGDNVTLADNRGNRKAYTLDRLKREAPELFSQVVQKKLSANKAAIQAGFRIKTLSIPFSVDLAAKALKKHFTASQLAELKKLL